MIVPSNGLQVPFAKYNLKGVSVGDAPVSSVKGNEYAPKAALISDGKVVAFNNESFFSVERKNSG